MGSTEEAILSAQMGSKCFSVNKFMTSPAPQMQKQCDGNSSGNNAGASAGSKRLEQKEMRNSAAKIIGRQQQQQQQRQWQQSKPRFAPELDGLHCFETLVPL